MDLKRITSSLLFKIVVAIILGIACSFFFPVWLARVFAPFNGLFGNFLAVVDDEALPVDIAADSQAVVDVVAGEEFEQMHGIRGFNLFAFAVFGF